MPIPVRLLIAFWAYTIGWTLGFVAELLKTVVDWLAALSVWLKQTSQKIRPVVRAVAFGLIFLLALWLTVYSFWLTLIYK